jgi:hypothetical protein
VHPLLLLFGIGFVTSAPFTIASEKDILPTAVGAGACAVGGHLLGKGLGKVIQAAFLRAATARGGGTLTATESAELQSIANEFGTQLDVVGSRAAGQGRNVGTNLSVGKGPGCGVTSMSELVGKRILAVAGRWPTEYSAWETALAR